MLLHPHPNGFPQQPKPTSMTFSSFFFFLSTPSQHQTEEDFAAGILAGLRKHPSRGGRQR